VIFVLDSSAENASSTLKEALKLIDPRQESLTVFNKVDLTPELSVKREADAIYLSALTGDGMPLLLDAIREKAGFTDSDSSEFIARQRHIDALDRAQTHVWKGVDQLETYQAGELLAEELKLAQHALGEITGVVSSDDLLGLIFGSFCIGK